MAYTKVFVGNLSFKTRGQDLAGEFAAAGKVMDANIITRGNRSLGYGFVDMETEDCAKSAVSLMNKKNVDGRDINVELARPRDEEKIAERRAKQQADRLERPAGPYRGRRPRQPRKSVEEKDASAESQENKTESNAASNDNGEKSPAARGKRRPKSRTASKSADLEKGEEKLPVVASDANDNNENKEMAAASPKSARPRRSRRPRRFFRKNDNEETPSDDKSERRGPPYPRRRRNSSRLEGGTPSTTSLFVANLPFAVDNQALEEAFQDHHVSSAKVIMNKFGKSKGFGFVEVASEKDQQEALEAMHEKPLQGRNIAVKIAIILKPREETERSDDASETKKAETETEKPNEETPK